MRLETRNKLGNILFVCLVIPMVGCSAIMSRPSKANTFFVGSPVMCGPRLDTKLIRNYSDEKKSAHGDLSVLAFALIDFPFSLAFDAFMLPLDVAASIATDQQGNSCKPAGDQLDESNDGLPDSRVALRSK